MKNVTLSCCVAVCALFLVGLLLVIQITMLACLSVLVMNLIMPEFGVHYELTWTQAYLAGFGISLIRSVLVPR